MLGLIGLDELCQKIEPPVSRRTRYRLVGKVSSDLAERPVIISLVFLWS
jgi:hypothetical protein